MLTDFDATDPIWAVFWKFVPYHLPENVCWPWQGVLFANGYGRLGNERAHRLMWERFAAHPGDGLVCHHCDNPPCVNPTHLFFGDMLANIRDKVAKGRQPRGETHGKARLTVSDVLEIRRLSALHEMSQQAIADLFEIGPAAVSKIHTRRTWSHI